MYVGSYAICVLNWNWWLTQDHFLIKHGSQRTHRCSARVVGLEQYSLVLVSRYSTVRSGTLTWREWGLWLNQQICKSPAPWRSSKLTHTGVEIDTCAFQTGCQLSSAASGMSLGLCFFTQFHEANVLDNWQLAVLPQSGCREFNSHRVHDNSSVTFVGLHAFPSARASKLNQQKCQQIAET